MLTLLDPKITRQSPTSNDSDSKPTARFIYTKSFDVAQVQHALEVILSLVRFGGQGFTRVAKSCTPGQSHDPDVKTVFTLG